MKTEEEIINECCQPYGGFVKVINTCGGTLVSQIWKKAMNKWADQFRQIPTIEIEAFNHADPAQTTEWVASWPLFPGMVVSAHTREQAIEELMTSIRIKLLYDFETKEKE